MIESFFEEKKSGYYNHNEISRVFQISIKNQNLELDHNQTMFDIQIVLNE
jgi:hypothetical protein